MTQEEYRSAVYQIIGCIASVLDIPHDDADLPEAADLEMLYQAAKKHHVTALVATYLKKHGAMTEEFNIALVKNQRKGLLYDIEAAKLTERLEAAGIRYMPLKGILLKKLYPELGQREMSDIDILFEEEHTEAVRKIMLEEGYTPKHYGITNHDVYTKAPFYAVEMHRELFDEMPFSEINRYYAQKDFLAVGDGCLCRMNDEDLYLYLITHLYQHYSGAGSGIRLLIDISLFLRRYGGSLDAAYIARELKELSLTDFEASVRNLSQKLWFPRQLSDQEREELDVYIFSGLYGNREQFIRNKVNNAITGPHHQSKLGYIINRFKVTDRKLKSSPFYSRHPRLRPLMTVTRPIKAVFTRPKAILRELSELKKVKK